MLNRYRFFYPQASRVTVFHEHLISYCTDTSLFLHDRFPARQELTGHDHVGGSNHEWHILSLSKYICLCVDGLYITSHTQVTHLFIYC